MRRPPKGNAAFVHDLLLFLEGQGFHSAPRFLGMDERGREILSYLESQTWPDSGSGLPDDLLVQAAKLIRSYHDVTAGSQLSQGHEIVAHHELGPHNTIFVRATWSASSIGIMRLLAHDCVSLSNAVYKYVDVGHWANQTADVQAGCIHLMCAAYGWDDPIALVNDARGRCAASVTQP